MALHLLNHGDADTLASCLRFCTEGDALLLLEDGVYHAVKPPAEIRVYALRDAVAERGLGSRVAQTVQTVDYPEFVSLCIEHEKTLSWF